MADMLPTLNVAVPAAQAAVLFIAMLAVTGQIIWFVVRKLLSAAHHVVSETFAGIRDGVLAIFGKSRLIYTTVKSAVYGGWGALVTWLVLLAFAVAVGVGPKLNDDPPPSNTPNFHDQKKTPGDAAIKAGHAF